MLFRSLWQNFLNFFQKFLRYLHLSELPVLFDFIFKADGALNTINQKAQEVQTNANNAKTSETNSKNSATASATSATNSANSALESKSYAIGTNNSFRKNDSTDNSKYYSEKSREYSNTWKGSLLPKGIYLLLNFLLQT